MTAFHDTQLPAEIEQGSTVGPSFSTGIVRLSNGAEARNQNWQAAKLLADITYGVMTAADGYAAVLSFFRARRGRLYAFRFKDWTDFMLSGELIGTGDGNTKAFQLIKTYPDEIAPYVRNIQLPVDGTLTVAIDGVPTTGFAVNKGVVSFTAAPAAGASVRATCEFDTPMRFDNDELDLKVYNVNASEVSSITLTEVVL